MEEHQATTHDKNLIALCRRIGHGHIDKVYVQDGLPIRFEEAISGHKL